MSAPAPLTPAPVAIRLHVPGIPTAKGRPRIGTRAGRPCAFTPAKTVAYEGLVAHEGSASMNGQEPLDGALRCEIIATFPIPASWPKSKRAAAVAGEVWHTSRPDGDNIAKAIGDGLNGVVWRDDSQVASWEIAKRYGVLPGVSVTVVVL
jgi:Holliday junction resolvase RusA-like endonuclease